MINEEVDISSSDPTEAVKHFDSSPTEVATFVHTSIVLS